MILNKQTNKGGYTFTPRRDKTHKTAIYTILNKGGHQVGGVIWSMSGKIETLERKINTQIKWEKWYSLTQFEPKN